MNIRIVFGCLCLLLSIAFCAVQLVTLLTSPHVAGTPLVLQFSSALACLLLASLAVQRGQRMATVIISAMAFIVCFLALLSAGILAMKGTDEMAPIKFVVFLAYAGLYGIFGLACSLLAGKPANDGTAKTPDAAR